MKIITCFFVCVIAFATAFGQQTLQIQSLSLDLATSLALLYNPSLRVAQAAERAASAGVTSAKAAYYPTLSGSVVTTRTDGSFVFNPDTPVRIQSYNNYTAGVAYSQTLFDFGKTINRVSANSSFEQAAVNDVETTRENKLADQILLL